MRKKIIQLGQVKTVMVISLFSIIISVLIYIPIGYFIQGNVLFEGIIVSVLAPAIIAPIASWYMVKLFIQIDKLETQMRQLVTFDSLTGVMSRQAFLTNAHIIYELIQRNKSSMAILYIDIDDFKIVNDTYGHHIGDEVLKGFGSILLNNKRQSDLVGRLGGEEFAIVLSDTNLEGAMNFANNLLNTVNSTTVEYEEIKISYSISIGVSMFNEKNQVDLNELIKQSDEALYTAKTSGKNRAIVYEKSS